MPAVSTTPALFSADDLGGWMGVTVTPARSAAIERVVWGWLKPVLGAAARPQPVPEEVFSWAVELGAIAHENPAGLSSKQLGPGQEGFSLERRQEILQLAAEGGSTTGALTPQGSFPVAQPYPDPASCW